MSLVSWQDDVKRIRCALCDFPRYSLSDVGYYYHAQPVFNEIPQLDPDVFIGQQVHLQLLQWLGWVFFDYSDTLLIVHKDSGITAVSKHNFK